MRLFCYLSVLWLWLVIPSISAASVALFGKSETRASSVHYFPKWVRVLENSPVELENMDLLCDEKNTRFFCNLKEWTGFVDDLKEMSAREKIDKVNRFANEKEYIIDQINWGVEDYWETPGEFLMKNGDCEDYAIIKYMSLLRLGFSPDNMRIVILNDNNLGVIHAVLAVYHDDEVLILDNQISRVTSHKRIFHYTPIYSINEYNWWRHG